MECKKRATTRRERANGEKERANECKLKDESVCLLNDVMVSDRETEVKSEELTTADGLLFVGVCRLCVSSGVVLLGERGNLYFCNKVITNALPQGA